MSALAQCEPLAVTECPNCGQRLRVRKPRAGYKLQVKCGRCPTIFDYPRPDAALAVRRPPPVTITQDNQPHPLQSGALMLKMVYGEMRIRCAKTGAPWSAIFQKTGNSDKFIFMAARAGDDLALHMMVAALSGNPDVRAAAPEPMNFANGSLLFGNMTCPCCGFVSKPGYQVIFCNHHRGYICCATQREVSPDWHEAICHPQCDSHPEPLILEPDYDDMRGYTMTVLQRGGAS